MKQLVTLSALLLTGSSLAQAPQTLEVTSGSGDFKILTNGLNPLGEANFLTAGTGFSYSGRLAIGPGDLFQFGAYPPGPPPSIAEFEADTLFETPTISLTVHGVPFAYNPKDGISGAQVVFNMGPFEFSGPGTFYSPFAMGSAFTGAPANVLAANPDICVQMPLACSTFNIQGGGIATYDVGPDMFVPGYLSINQITLTFTAPEPPTIALALLGFAGLAVLGPRCRSRAKLIPRDS